MMNARNVAVLVTLAAALRLVAAVATRAVEAVYARGLYPHIARALGQVANLSAAPIAEPVMLSLVLLVAVATVRRLSVQRGRRWRAVLASMASYVVGLAAGIYLVFLLIWGLNYQRLPLASIASLDARSPSRAELAEIGTALVNTANTFRASLAEDGAGVFRVDGGLAEMLPRTARGFAAVATGRPWLGTPVSFPKVAPASALFSRLGISGIYSPFTAEALVNDEVPNPALPFAASHEMAHALGFAREDEANYLGSLACRLHPDADFRYSGTLEASAYVVAALGTVDATAARALHAQRSDGVRRDLAALDAWSARHAGPVSRVSRRVNDAYLRTQGQRDGVESYGRFVDLLVGEKRAEGRLLGSPD